MDLQLQAKDTKATSPIRVLKLPPARHKKKEKQPQTPTGPKFPLASLRAADKIQLHGCDSTKPKTGAPKKHGARSSTGLELSLLFPRLTGAD